ncbi:MAG TPA: hypothetical protein VMT71_11760 [Syntrophorhabdales bacterium]|nr:hypothetical protein [Syntrophorhabdales bacterium]
MQDVCVAHLVRAKNSIEPLQRFLESYGRNHGGVGHDLLFILKGFHNEDVPAATSDLLDRYPHQKLFVPDNGFDVMPYLFTASTYENNYFCFLNSFSILLDPDWLKKMHSIITGEDVGIVGATGSYQSMYSDLANFYELVLTTPFYRRVLSTFTIPMRMRKLKRDFYPFPNHHIRTNAFMIEGRLMRKVKIKPVHTKMDAYHFESGKDNLTRQILEMGLEALVVGRDGKAYKKEEWYRSFTFWHGDQGNLLVADNQTNAYMAADLERKWQLARHAWSNKANPLETYVV